LSEREKSSVSEMVGETLREIGVLIFVFVPLEAYRGDKLRLWDLSLWIASTLVVSTLLIAAGIIIERKRPS
jgi:hypothetical protein